MSTVGPKRAMQKIIDTHIHVGHRYEWTEAARAVWLDRGPYVPDLYDTKGEQLAEKYGEVIKREVWAGLLIPEYSPLTAGVMPFERAADIARFHPELVPVANLNPEFHSDLVTSFEEQIAKGARALKIHPIHGFFFANDKRLYPIYARCQAEQFVVLFHAGTSLFPGCEMRYTDPYTFNDVVSDFPDLKIVLCHGGRGFWYHIADFLIKRFANVYIDVSGLPPAKLIEYFPSLPGYSHKFLFGSDFPGVPGIKANYEVIADVLGDTSALDNLGFQNAYNLFGFWREGLFEVHNTEGIFEVVNDAAWRYKGAIPKDRWHEPYMPMEEVEAEMERMRFYGYCKDMKLLGVMGKEQVLDTTLVRHAYVRTEDQGKGIGSALIKYIEQQVATEWLLVGTWAGATWAVDFYRKHGYEVMGKKDELLRRYWDIPERQIETSVVLGKRMRK